MTDTVMGLRARSGHSQCRYEIRRRTCSACGDREQYRIGPVVDTTQRRPSVFARLARRVSGAGMMHQTTLKDLRMDGEWIDAAGGFDRLRLTDGGIDVDWYGESSGYQFGLTPEIAEKIRDGLTAWLEQKAL